jgi:hypothetical protein
MPEASHDDEATNVQAPLGVVGMTITTVPMVVPVAGIV